METYKKPVVASKNSEHSILLSLLSPKMIFVKATSPDENLQDNLLALTTRKKSAE